MGNTFSTTSQPPHQGQQPQSKAFKNKPGLLEPAFEGYSAGWRQGSIDDEDQQFSFATFQSGYEGDDEDSEVPIPKDNSAGREDSNDTYLREVRMWKERHDSNASASRKNSEGRESEANPGDGQASNLAANGRHSELARGVEHGPAVREPEHRLKQEGGSSDIA